MRNIIIQLNNFAFLLVITLFFIPITLPQLNALALYVILAILLFPIIIFLNFSKIYMFRHNKVLIGFLFVIIITMLIRGIGFESMGGNKQGGYLYIQVLAVVLGIFVAQICRPDIKKFRRFFKILLVSTIIFSFLKILISVGILPHSPYLMGIRETKVMYSVKNSFGIVRFYELRELARAILLLILLFRRSSKVSLLMIVIFILPLSISIFSGYRIGTIELLGVLFFAFWFSDVTSRLKMRQIFKFIVFFIAFWGLITSFQNSLPDVVVRSFSWLPGVTNEHATKTSNWRIDVWKLALEYEIPQYLLVGKGLSYGYEDRVNINEDEIYLSFMDTLQYHNGPITLTIAFGILGLLFFCLFHLFFIKFILHFRKLELYHNNFDIRVVFDLLVSFYLTQILLFFLVYGDVSLFFARLHITVALIFYTTNCFILKQGMNQN